MTIIEIKEWVEKYPRLDLTQYIIRKVIRSSNKCKEILSYERDPMMLHFRHYGNKHKGKIIYHIFINNNTSGYCYLLRNTLFHILFAERMGFIPVVEWTKDTLYSDGCNDAFLYCFNPISDICKNDLLESDLVVHSRDIDIHEISPNISYGLNEKEIDILADVIFRRIKLNKFGGKILIDSEDLLVRRNSGEKYLGVHYRGTDYKNNYARHPVMIGINSYFESIHELLDNQNYTKIFLATDEEVFVDCFKREFGSRVCYYDEVVRSKNGEAIHYGQKTFDKDKEYGKRISYEILRDVYTLSICNGFIAGLSNVSYIVRALKKSRGEVFSDLIILDKGTNNSMKEFKWFSKR